MTHPVRPDWSSVVFVVLAALGCESVNVESFDADRRLRPWGFREIDHEAANPAFPYAVRIEFEAAMRGDGTRCTGVLVGEDLVMTALHCLRAAGFFDADSCANTGRTGAMAVIVDDQVILDTDFEGPGASRPARRIAVARHDETTPALWRPVDSLRTEPTPGGSSGCAVVRDRDVAVVRLAEPVEGRGWARVRARDPILGSRTTIVHHQRGNPKRLQEATVVTPFIPDTIGIVPASLPAHIRSQGVDGGASGAPLFDADGYVVGVLSAGEGVTAEGGRIFTSLAHNLDSINENAGFDLVPGSRATTRMGMFTSVAPAFFGDMRLSPFPLMPTGREVANGLAFESANTLILVGTGGFPGARQPLIARYTTEGVFLDARLDDITPSPDEIFTDVTCVDAGGEPACFASGTESDIADTTMIVVRYDGTGARVPSFGMDGVLRLNDGGPRGGFPQAAAIARGVAGDGSARLIVAGHVGVGSDRQGAIVVARLKPVGLDPTCDGDGVFLWRPSSSPDNPSVAPNGIGMSDLVVTDVAVDALQRIVVTGYGHLVHSRRLFVGRLTPDCAPDSTFGSPHLDTRIPGEERVGIAFLGADAFGEVPGQVWGEAVAIDPSRGRTYVAGSRATFDPVRGLYGGRMIVVAFTADGMLDPTFGLDAAPPPGVVELPPSGWDEVAHGIALDGLGRVNLAGRSYESRAAPDGDVTRVAVAIVNAAGDVVVASTRDELRSSDEWANDIIIDPSGRAILAGAHRAPPAIVPGD